MSRFVSEGTDDNPAEQDEAWIKVQAQLEANKRQQAQPGTQEGGKSLYETLQANKAAKQDAFEESIRLKSQFRSLDEDEVEFLHSVLESTRAKEAEVLKETAKELEAFREQQEQAAKIAAPQETTEDAGSTSWTVGKKRKKGREDLLGGIKLRKSSSGDTALGQATKSLPDSKAQKVADDASAGLKGVPTPPASGTKSVVEKATNRDQSEVKPTASPSVPSLGLGLGGYSTEDED